MYQRESKDREQLERNEMNGSYTDMNNHRYISNICRNGPVSLSRHRRTDFWCTITLLVLFVLFFVLFMIDLIKYLTLNSQGIKQTKLSQLDFFEKLAYFLNHNLGTMAITAGVLISIGIIFYIIAILIPFTFGYIIIALCFVFLVFFLISLIMEDWSHVYARSYSSNSATGHNQTFRLSFFKILFILAAVAGIAVFIVLILSRKKKLKNLGILMQVNSYILKKNTPALPILMLFILSFFINLGIWQLMSFLFWRLIKMQHSIDSFPNMNFPIPLFIVDLLFILLWLWIHGLQLSISDYICQSWVVHWYYRQNRQEKQGLQTGWRQDIFLKLFKYHLGTIIYGSLFMYVPQNIVKVIKNKTNKKDNSSMQKPTCFTIFRSLNRYYAIETVLQCLNFQNANYELFFLRKRIKNKIPELYMLGHFIGDVMTILLILVGIYIIFVFNFKISNQKFNSYQLQISPVQFLLYMVICGFGLCLQISTNIAHLFGMLSDTAIITYSIDCEIQRVYYGSNHARSIPTGLKQELRPLFTNSIGSIPKPAKQSKKDEQNQMIKEDNHSYEDKSSIYRYSSLDGRKPRNQYA